MLIYNYTRSQKKSYEFPSSNHVVNITQIRVLFCLKQEVVIFRDTRLLLTEKISADINLVSLM